MGPALEAAIWRLQEELNNKISAGNMVADLAIKEGLSIVQVAPYIKVPPVKSINSSAKHFLQAQ
jgi:hypothetical protein